MVSQAALTLLLAAVALAAQVPQRWTLGDSRERVRQVQGPPDLIERLTSLNREVWSYRTSSVTFDPHTGHVVEYVDADRLARSLGLGPAALRPAADWTAAPPDAPLWVQVGADWRACPHP